MNVKVIGIGAAGNKAAIELIESKVVEKSNVYLLNSTLKDIPTGYADMAVQFSSTVNGCGKERDLAKNLILEALQNGTVKIDNLFETESDPDNNMVIIVNSSEGGTGCGASSIIAKYFKTVLGINVNMFVFTGFEDDCRGLQNTVEYFQELSEDYTIQAISNKKFLEDVNGNKMKAEKAANLEFVKRVKIMLGQIMVNSDQNIDDTDLAKLITTPGFMMIEYCELDKIKNVEMFNKAVSDMIDETKSLDVEPSAKRLGIILNVSDKTKDYIDYTFAMIQDKLGVPFERYPHIQSEPGVEFIAVIAAGVKMPMNDIKAIHNKYKILSEQVNKSKDDFFSLAASMKGNNEDSIFNMKKKTKLATVVDKNNFFSSINAAPKEKDEIGNY